MRIPTSLCAAAFAACVFLAPASAQIQVFGGLDEERTACTLIFADMTGGNFSPKGAVSISYSGPEWQDAYNKALDSGKFNGTNQRLGKNWWTSFDTMVPITIGSTQVQPGTYYLGIQVDDKGGFHLLFLDTKTVVQKGWAPFIPAPWKTETKATLTLAKDSLKETQSKMAIAITTNEKDPTTGKFSIQWGKHELWADVKFTLAAAKDASAEKAPK